MNYRQKSGYTVKSKQAIQTPPRQRLPKLVAVISTFGVAAMQPNHAQAATYAWKNVTGDWTVSANWASGIVPGAADVAIFNDAGEAQLNTLATIFGLTQSYGTISGTGNLTVTVAPGVGGVGALTVAGDFTQTAAGFSISISLRSPVLIH